MNRIRDGKTQVRCMRRIATAAASLAVCSVLHAQSSIEGLGDLPGGLGSHALAMSADGAVVVGFSYYIAPGGLLQSHAFRWTQIAGMTAVFEGGLDYTSAALAVSADGLFIGGWHAPTIVEEKAFIWSALTGEDVLNTRSGVAALSGNGLVGAGYVVQGRGEPPRASIWADGHLTFIDTPGVIVPGSDARGISADGLVVVGQAMFSPVTAGRAFRWTAAAGMQNIGSPDFGGPTSHADDVSADGSVVVGAAQTSGGSAPLEAARWTAATGWLVLTSVPGGTGGTAYAVSADGRTVVGASNGRAFVWREGRGPEDLFTAIGSPPGWTLVDARGVSADGTVVMGNGILVGAGSQPWVARLPCLAVSIFPDVTVCAGGSATIGVSVTGPGPFGYQWRHNTVPIDSALNPSAATASLVLTSVTPIDAGLYDCVISAACGSVTSDGAALSICRADTTCDGRITPADIATFVNLWFASLQLGTLDGDFDNNGFVQPADVATFVTAWFTALTNGC